MNANLTPKAMELIKALKANTSYSMSGMGDLVYESHNGQTRQAIALKISRFARQLLDANYLRQDVSTNLYLITSSGLEFISKRN